MAAAVAAAVGVVAFLAWWTTKPGHRPPSTQPAELRRSKPIEPPSTARGGRLTGSIREVDEQQAITLLTQAPLFRINRSTDRVEPWLAESWTTSTNNLTYTIKLRPNIVWSNGRPLVAADVVAAVARSDASARVWGKRLSARAIDPLQVEITFPAPFAPGLRALDKLPIVPVQKQDEPPAGLGPFVLKTPVRGDTALLFERNRHYWRRASDGKPLPYLDEIVLERIPDQNAELQQLMDGRLDFIESELRPEDYIALERADQSGKIRLYDLEAGLDADALWLNVSKRWMAKDEFRLALSAAINRRAFCAAVYLGACDPIWVPVTPGNPAWFDPNLPVAGPDQELARAMLAGIGLQDSDADGMLDDDQGRPVRFTILVRRDSSRDGLGARFIRDELKKLGVGVDVVAIDADTLNARRLTGDYDGIYGRVISLDTDPAMNLDFWLCWDSTPWGAQLARLMRKQAATTDPAQRVEIFAEVQKTYLQHMPAIVFGAPYTYLATSERVLNAKPSRQQPTMLWNAERLAAR